MAVVHIDAPSWSGLGELGALLWLKTIPLSRVYTIVSPRIYICVDDDVAPCSSSLCVSQQILSHVLLSVQILLNACKSVLQI